MKQEFDLTLRYNKTLADAIGAGLKGADVQQGLLDLAVLFTYLSNNAFENVEEDMDTLLSEAKEYVGVYK